MVSASNQPRRKMATLIQEDLARVGIRLRLQPTEFGVMMDAVLKTRKFDGRSGASPAATPIPIPR